jgi:hypothetical protein
MTSSLGLGKVSESMGCSGEGSQRRGDAERGKMASRGVPWLYMLAVISI